MIPLDWILYGAIATCAWLILAFGVLVFFGGVKCVNKEDPNNG